MKTGMMTLEELSQITGRRQHAAQERWLRDTFGISPVRSANGRVCITWETFHALEAKHVGLLNGQIYQIDHHQPQVRSIRRPA